MRHCDCANYLQDHGGFRLRKVPLGSIADQNLREIILEISSLVGYVRNPEVLAGVFAVDWHNGLQSELSSLPRRNFPTPTMPRLKNRLHERFAWLIAEGMDRKAAYLKLCPHVSDPATLGYKLYHRMDVKSRISEIQCEVHSRALMAIDEKRDRLRQMIEGVIPTKVTKRRDGTVEAVFDMLGALVADAKMAGEFDGTAAVKEPEIKLEFEMYHRNHPNPPLEWLNRALVVPKVISES